MPTLTLPSRAILSIVHVKLILLTCLGVFTNEPPAKWIPPRGVVGAAQAIL